MNLKMDNSSFERALCDMDPSQKAILQINLAKLKEMEHELQIKKQREEAYQAKMPASMRNNYEIDCVNKELEKVQAKIASLRNK